MRMTVPLILAAALAAATPALAQDANNTAAVDLYRSLGFRVMRTMYRVAPVEESLF